MSSHLSQYVRRVCFIAVDSTYLLSFIQLVSNISVSVHPSIAFLSSRKLSQFFCSAPVYFVLGASFAVFPSSSSVGMSRSARRLYLRA